MNGNIDNEIRDFLFIVYIQSSLLFPHLFTSVVPKK